MKKLILVVTMLLFSISVKAQITKGYWMLGGDANFYYNKVTVDDNNSDESNSFIIRPRLGYFVKDKVALGLISDFYFSIGGASKSAYLNPFVRYYFLATEKNLIFFQNCL